VRNRGDQQARRCAGTSVCRGNRSSPLFAVVQPVCSAEPSPISELHSCIERVNRGEIWAGREQAQYLLEALRNLPSSDGVEEGKFRLLSKRELQVAEHAAQGQSNEQIADELKLSEHTVKNYLFRVFEKLGVSSRCELLFLLFNAL
jgi:two-component system, NarL family, nitrate/nitrite response regulator NarL